MNILRQMSDGPSTRLLQTLENDTYTSRQMRHSYEQSFEKFNYMIFLNIFFFFGYFQVCYMHRIKTYKGTLGVFMKKLSCINTSSTVTNSKSRQGKLLGQSPTISYDIKFDFLNHYTVPIFEASDMWLGI